MCCRFYLWLFIECVTFWKTFFVDHYFFFLWLAFLAAPNTRKYIKRFFLEKHFSPKKWMCARCMCKWPTHEQYTSNLQNDQNTPRTTKMIKYSWDNKNDQMIYVILFSHESSMLFWDVITYYWYPKYTFLFFKIFSKDFAKP